MKIDEPTKDTLHWLISELWKAFILSKMAHLDMLEDELERIILFIKKQGISEVSMALEEDISIDGINNLIKQFKLN